MPLSLANRIRIVVAGAALALLAACTSPAAPIAQSTAEAAATISAAVLPAADLASVQKTCASASTMLNAATSSAMPAAVSGTAIDAQAYCAQLAQAPVGEVPATTDSNTPTWLPGVIAGVQVAAQIAGAVLPALL